MSATSYPVVIHPQRKRGDPSKNLSDRTIYVGGGVDNTTVLIDFEVYMRAGRTTCRANQGNVLTFVNNISNIDQQLFRVSLAGRVATTVINFYHQSVAGTRP